MFDELIGWLPGCAADVLCLQEVTRTPGLGGWTTFRDAERELPQRANLYADVAGLMTRHQGSFVASMAGPVVDAHGVSRRQDFGLALFVAEDLPVVGQAAGFVYGSFVEGDEWPDSVRPRLAQGVRIVDRQCDRTVAIVQLHGLRDPAGKHDTGARREQAARLVDLVERLRSRDDLVIVCGDLNLLPDSETFDVLARIGLSDLVGTADTRTSRYTKAMRHANYLLVSNSAAVMSFEVLAAPEVSDHRPLILDI